MNWVSPNLGSLNSQGPTGASVTIMICRRKKVPLWEHTKMFKMELPRLTFWSTYYVLEILLEPVFCDICYLVSLL